MRSFAFLKNTAKILLALTLALLLVFSAVACNSDDKGSDEQNEENEQNGGNKQNNTSGGMFSVTYNGTTVELGKDAKAVLKKLGEPKETNFVASCGEGAGEQYVYEYASVYVYTVKNGDSEVIDGLKLRDDSALTSKSIRIGSEQSAVVSAYGEKELDRGHLVYTQGSYSIDFTIDDGGKVSGIELRTETN